ncbi:MAG: thioredoxin domain-containing protein [Planctomycetales bacterium]|nr:thioredoxin domain-containing protein [Planctomycetales bacterium]
MIFSYSPDDVGRSTGRGQSRLRKVESLESREMMAFAGDANFDGVFDSADLVQVFQAGKFETEQAAEWSEGDWDHNGFFNTSDLVAAFQLGRYGQPAQPNTFYVDENSPRGTVVGRVQNATDLTAPVVYEIVDRQIDARLQVSSADHLLGDPAAPVVLIEYLDFQCPICASYHSVLQQLESDFSGELLVIRRHLPLTAIHPNALAASLAAEAAGIQEMFNEYADLLLTRQSEWEAAPDPNVVFQQYASELQLNMDQFRTDLASADVLRRIQSDIDTAFELNVNGVPAFYVNGSRVEQLPFSSSDFESIIDDELHLIDSAFALNRLSGELIVWDPSKLDYEATPTQNLTVQVTDSNNNSVSVEITVNLNDLNE